MKIFDYINTTTYSWVAPIFFIVFILKAMSIGFIHGTKTASYFGIFNLFCFITTIIVIAFTFNKLTSLIPGNIALGGKTIPIGTALNSAKDTVKSLVVIIATFASYSIFLFLSIFIYFFLRKRLKQKIKNVTFKESISSRFGGAGITLLYMLPFIMTATSFATIFSHQNAFVDTTSKITKGVTGNQVSDLRTKSLSMYKTIKSVQDVLSTSNTLKDIFNAANDQDGKTALNSILKNENTKEAFKFLLTDDFVNQNIGILSKFDVGAVDNINDDTLLKITYQATESPIEVNAYEFIKIKSSIAKLISSGKNSSVNLDSVGTFLNQIKLFKLKP